MGPARRVPLVAGETGRGGGGGGGGGRRRRQGEGVLVRLKGGVGDVAVGAQESIGRAGRAPPREEEAQEVSADWRQMMISNHGHVT